MMSEVETKICEVCGDPYERPEGISNDNWRDRKTCSTRGGDTRCMVELRSRAGKKGGRASRNPEPGPVPGEDHTWRPLRDFVRVEPRIGWLFR